MIRLFWRAVCFEGLLLRRSINDLMVLITLPLFTLAFLAILVESGRRDLASVAIVGSAVMSIWSMALYVSGSMIVVDQWAGTLEAAATTPAPFGIILIGRITTVTAVSLLGLVESSVLAWLTFGIQLRVFHPAIFLLTLGCTLIAVIGTSFLLAGIFILGRSAQTFQNSLTYPFYVLAGAVVPVIYLPSWLQPVSKMVFLSWVAELLRDSLSPATLTDVRFKLGMILLLGLLALVIGLWTTRRIFRRLRHLGKVGLA